MGLVLVGGEEVKFYHCRINPQKLVNQSAAALVDQSLVDSHSSFIRSKHGRGGFSANRFERLRENEVDHYTKAILNLHGEQNQECQSTLFYGSKDKIERLKSHCLKQPYLNFVVGSATDYKAQIGTLLEISTQYFRTHECKALALLKQQLLENKGDSLVYGEKECQLAMSQKMVQTIWMSTRDNTYDKQQNEYVIYGFTAEGIKFRQEFGIVALLYPGCSLEKN